jgi:hypothetical protein
MSHCQCPIGPTGRGYYLNSLKAWRIDLYKQLRQEMARYNRLEGSFHPDRPDMGRLCDLTKEIIQRGAYNMFDPRARVAARLSKEDYAFCMRHFTALKEAANAQS